MKLADLKQGLIQKFFKQIEDGLPRERAGAVYQRLRDHLNTPRIAALLEGETYHEHDNALKAFREFDSSPYAALEAYNDEKVYFIVGKSGRRNYACAEVTCEDAEPRAVTSVGVKQALLEIRDEFGDSVRYRVRTPALLKEVFYLRDKTGSDKVRQALERVHKTFTNAGFDVFNMRAGKPFLARYGITSTELNEYQLNVQVTQDGDDEYTLNMYTNPPCEDRPAADLNIDLKNLTEDSLVKELRSAWTKFRPSYEKLKKAK